jgi:hypothetical protein
MPATSVGERTATPTSELTNRSPSDFYTPAVEKYGAGLVDDAAKDNLNSFADTYRSMARTWWTGLQNDMSRNTISIFLTGQSFDQLPEQFRKAELVGEAAVKRIFAPWSLKSGYGLVDASGNQLNAAKNELDAP